MPDFVMPALGADMESGKVVQWRVAPGDRVRAGDVVAVVETQKGAIDVEIFLEGVIGDLAPIGVQVPVGGKLASVRADEAAARVAPGPATPLPVAPLPTAPLPVAPRGDRRQVTPAARSEAGRRGIDLSQVRGTGPEGSVVLRDVEAAASRRPAAPPRPAAAGGFDPVQMRAAIAAAMSRSKREIPHYYLTQEMDFGPAADWLTGYNAVRAPAQRLLPAALLLKATARALAEVPQLNGFYDQGTRLSPAIHVGWAISLRGGGLVAPAVHDVPARSIGQAMDALRDLVQRARTGGLRSSELTDATVTVTNLGERGADGVLGVVYPPQLALVGFGRIAPRPWVDQGQLVVRPTVHVSLAADHRASDGHLGGQFLAAIAAALAEPAGLEGAAP